MLVVPGSSANTECPEFKGIKTHGRGGIPQGCKIPNALNSKGLRLKHMLEFSVIPNTECPEFKGIKTATACVASVSVINIECPEFKGIKTRGQR